MDLHDLPEQKKSYQEQILPLLWNLLQPVLRMQLLVQEGRSLRTPLSKRSYSQLAESARACELFLSDHGAWANQTFMPLIESVSMTRSLSIVGHTLSHIQDRLGIDSVGNREELEETFAKETNACLDFVKAGLEQTLIGARESAARIYKEDLPLEPMQVPQRQQALPQLQLPADLEKVAPEDLRAGVVEMASRFFSHKKRLESNSCKRIFRCQEDMQEYVNNVCTEEECRYFETRIQSLIGQYDTHLKGSSLESRDQDLSRVRGYLSTVGRLSRIITEFVHIHERHGKSDAHSSLLRAVNHTRLLDRALNYALFHIHIFMDEAAPLVDGLLARYAQRERLVLKVPDDVSFHIRPVSLLAKIVEHHKMPVSITIGSTTCFAGSIVQVLMACGAHPDVREMVFEGDKAVLHHLKLLFECGLGDRGPESLPPELSYLAS